MAKKQEWYPRGNNYRPRISQTSKLRVQVISKQTLIAENVIVDLAIGVLYAVWQEGGLQHLTTQLPANILGNKIVKLSEPVRINLEEGSNHAGV